MAHLANIRAEEIGAAVLWCDGGVGAVGGVYGAGRGMEGMVQTGNGGTWMTTIGVPFLPGEDEEEGKEVDTATLYARWGDWSVLLAMGAFVLAGLLVEVAGAQALLSTSGSTFTLPLGGRVRGLVAQAFRRVTGRGDEEAGEGQHAQEQQQRGNLIDMDF